MKVFEGAAVDEGTVEEFLARTRWGQEQLRRIQELEDQRESWEVLLGLAISYEAPTVKRTSMSQALQSLLENLYETHSDLWAIEALIYWRCLPDPDPMVVELGNFLYSMIHTGIITQVNQLGHQPALTIAHGSDTDQVPEADSSKDGG